VDDDPTNHALIEAYLNEIYELKMAGDGQ